MKNHNLAFVDLETTGLDPYRHEIVEIGIVIAEQRKDIFGTPALEKISETEILLLPEHIETADREALRIGHYFDRDRSGALTQQNGLIRARNILEGCIFVAQNVAFDWSFLRKAGNEYNVDVESAVHYHKLDLASMALGKFYNDPRLQRYSLREMTDFFDVKNANAHNALSDARATFEVAKIIVRKQ